MTCLGRIFAVIAASCLLSGVVQAQPKIATLNLKTVFDGYWKTKQADIQLKDRQADFDKARKGMLEDYQKANDDYAKLVDSANDQAASAEERDKRKKTAETKLMEIKEIQQSIGAFDRNMNDSLRNQQKRMRDLILRDIREIIDKRARSAGYGMVFDTAAESIAQTPIVLFTTGLPDLTEEVLTQLNATAQTGALTTGDKVDENKEKAGDKKEGDKGEKK